MPLKLMYITNRPDVALIAEQAGVDQMFIDMEFIGKRKRQSGMDTVQSHHTIDDIYKIRNTVSTAELMVRINPIHEAGSEDGYQFTDSKTEIDDAIAAGADILMLPYFKTVDEVRQFIEYVDGRAITFPLLETKEAVDVLDEILELPGLDRIHVGLNDLSISKQSGFMFGLLADGTVDSIAESCRNHKIPFGFGGIAGIGQGLLPSEYIIGEHYRLDSEFVILSRSFCNCSGSINLDRIEKTFQEGIPNIRRFEARMQARREAQDTAFFEKNHAVIADYVQRIQKI